MATITERELKDGTKNYKIQVKVKNKATGKTIIKSTTWYPKEHLSEQANKKALNYFAMQYEETIRNRFQFSNVVDRDITVEDFSEIWLKFVRENRSPNYAISMNAVLKDINSSLGKYKLNELNPYIIQNYIDELQGETNDKSYMVENGFRKEVCKQLLTQVELHKRSGVSRQSIKKALDGEPIDYYVAVKLSKAVGKENPMLLFDSVQTKKEYTNSSKARKYRTLRAMLSYAVKHQYIETNYATSEYVETIKEQRNTREFLDEEEIKILLESLKSSTNRRARAAITTLIFTGLRNGELCGLEWQDIDFDKATINVLRASKYVAGKGLITGTTKTQNSKRKIAIPPILVDELKDYKEWWDVFVKTIDTYTGSDRLILSMKGQPIDPKEVLRWLHTETDRAGLKRVCLHSLRHSNITFQLAAGVPLKIVSARAGHSTTQITADIYAHMIKSSDRQAATALQKFLS